MKKIALIGPVYPYKGGIAHYTSLMYKALSKKYEVVMISYSMQYPKVLFRKEQKDYTNKTFAVDNTHYWINTANPFNWIKTAKKIKKLHVDLVIIQWWHPYFAPCYWAVTKLLKNTKLLFICHNVFPHERFPLDKFLTYSTLKQGDGFVVQSQMDSEDLVSILPNAIYRKAVHPTYNAFKLQNLTQKESRKLLNVSMEKNILLFFGFVREYKGLKYLLNALPDVIEKNKNIELFIVGDFDGDKGEYEKIIQKNLIEDYVCIYDGYIPDQEVEKFFAACNLVVLPYTSATQSGIIQIAYGFEKPVVVTNVGGLPDVVINEQTGYVVAPKNPKEIAKAICKYFEENREEQFIENVRKESDKFSWDRMTETIEAIEKELGDKQ